jgi:RNA polymerase sigma-70 factor, ECF subfamily
MLQNVETQKLEKTSRADVDYSLDSRRYIRRLRKGEKAALAELVAAVAPRLRRVASAITRNTDDAEDVVQSAIVQAMVHFRQLRCDAKFSHWLMRITVNEARRHRRLAYNRLSSSLDSLPLEEFEDGCQSAVQTLLQEERGRAVRKAVREIEPQCRQVLVLHYWRQIAICEIARILGISETNVKTRLYRARKRVLSVLRRNEAMRTITFPVSDDRSLVCHRSSR